MEIPQQLKYIMHEIFGWGGLFFVIDLNYKLDPAVLEQDQTQ